MKNKIPVNDLKDGYLYEIEARNQNRGIWREAQGGFEIARTKFESTYLFVEYEWDLGMDGNLMFGTARAFREVEKVPDDVLSDDNKRLEYLKAFTEPTVTEVKRYNEDEKFRKWVDIMGYPDYGK